MGCGVDDGLGHVAGTGRTAGPDGSGRPTRPRPSRRTAPRVDNDLQRLTRREREVSRLIAEGLTNRQICQALSISERTVGSHVDHIMTKLNARSRTRIAVWAIEHGLGGLGPTPARPSG